MIRILTHTLKQLRQFRSLQGTSCLDYPRSPPPAPTQSPDTGQSRGRAGEEQGKSRGRAGHTQRTALEGMQTLAAPLLPNPTIINSRCRKLRGRDGGCPPDAGKVKAICQRAVCRGKFRERGSWRRSSLDGRTGMDGVSVQSQKASYLTCPTYSARSGACLSRSWPCSSQTPWARSSEMRASEVLSLSLHRPRLYRSRLMGRIT